MKYRKLGDSGTRVSEIALGNWVTHGGQVGDDAAHACVRAALDADINFFDTADVYEWGKAETVLGAALDGIARHTYVLATKVFFPTGHGVNDRGLGRKHMMESCHASLRRLRTDYVDIYQAHRFDADTPLEETVRAFDDLVRQGKVLYIGVSEWTAEQIQAALDISTEWGLHRIQTNQPQYSMLWRVPEAEVIPLCEQEGIGQVVWSPLAMGVLTGKYQPGEAPPAGTRGAERPGETGYRDDKTLTAVQRLRPIADGLDLTMAQLALAWVLQQDNVSAAITGATRPEQVADNVKAAGVRLDAATMKAIDEALGDVVIRKE